MPIHTNLCTFQYKNIFTQNISYISHRLFSLYHYPFVTEDGEGFYMAGSVASMKRDKPATDLAINNKGNSCYQ